MSSSGRYQSWLLNFLDRQFRVLHDRSAVGLRRLKLRVTWGAQLLLYPIYVTLQTTRFLKQEERSTPALKRLMFKNPEKHSVEHSKEHFKEHFKEHAKEPVKRLEADAKSEIDGSQAPTTAPSPYPPDWLSHNSLPSELLHKLWPESVRSFINAKAREDTEKTLRALDGSIAFLEDVTAQTPLPDRLQRLHKILDTQVFGKWIPPLPTFFELEDETGAVHENITVSAPVEYDNVPLGEYPAVLSCSESGYIDEVRESAQATSGICNDHALERVQEHEDVGLTWSEVFDPAQETHTSDAVGITEQASRPYEEHNPTHNSTIEPVLESAIALPQTTPNSFAHASTEESTTVTLEEMSISRSQGGRSTFTSVSPSSRPLSANVTESTPESISIEPLLLSSVSGLNPVDASLKQSIAREKWEGEKLHDRESSPLQIMAKVTSKITSSNEIVRPEFDLTRSAEDYALPERPPLESYTSKPYISEPYTSEPRTLEEFSQAASHTPLESQSESYEVSPSPFSRESTPLSNSLDQGQSNHEQFNHNPSSLFHEGEEQAWIDVDMVPIGYEKHPLERVLHWLDRLMVWVEKTVAWLWKQWQRSHGKDYAKSRSTQSRSTQSNKR